MARLIDPLYGDSATGGVAGVLYFKDQGDYQTVANRPHRISRKSPGQISQRSNFRGCCTSWLGLSPEEKSWWVDNKGDLPSGFSAYMQSCLIS